MGPIDARPDGDDRKSDGNDRQEASPDDNQATILHPDIETIHVDREDLDDWTQADEPSYRSDEGRGREAAYPAQRPNVEGVSIDFRETTRQPEATQPSGPGSKVDATIDIRVIIGPFLTEGHSELTGRLNEADRDRAVAEARHILAAPSEAREVDAHELEAVTLAVLKIIEKAPELLEKVVDEVTRDSSSSAKLRSLLADPEQFRDVTSRVAEQVGERDRPHAPIMFLVLAGACLLGGGAAIPLVWGAKAELIYTNAVAAASLVCAGAALAKQQGT